MGSLAILPLLSYGELWIPSLAMSKFFEQSNALTYFSANFVPAFKKVGSSHSAFLNKVVGLAFSFLSRTSVCLYGLIGITPCRKEGRRIDDLITKIS